MTQGVSRFDVVTEQQQHWQSVDDATHGVRDQSWPGKRIFMGGGHVENTGASDRSSDVIARYLPNRRNHFADQCCPICGSFVCDGC